MIDLNLTNIEDLIHIENLNGAPVGNLMYIHFDMQGPTSDKNNLFEDRKELRNLKVDELIGDEDKTIEIRELESRISMVGKSEDYYPEILAPSMKTLSVSVNKKIRVEDSEGLSEITNNLRREVLDKIYQISAINKTLNKQHILDLDFTEKTKKNLVFVSNKIVSRMLSASNFIAMEGRVGTGNIAIMNNRYAQFLVSLINTIIPNKDSKSLYKFAHLAGLDIIIDDSLGDKIVVCRKPSDKTQLNNNIVLFYNTKDCGIDYDIIQVESCQSNYIEFDINGLDI